MKLKPNIFAATFVLYFSNYLTKSKYYDKQNKLVNGKTKDISGGLAIEEFVVLKQKKIIYFQQTIVNMKIKKLEQKSRYHKVGNYEIN